MYYFFFQNSKIFSTSWEDYSLTPKGENRLTKILNCKKYDRFLFVVVVALDLLTNKQSLRVKIFHSLFYFTRNYAEWGGLFVFHEQVKDELYNKRKAVVKVSGDSMCSLCNKKIGTSVFAVYPNGTTLVHFVCFRDSQTMKAVRGSQSRKR